MKITRMTPVIQPGCDDRLGATVRDGGVNFAIFSQHATRLELCLFDKADHEIARLPMICGKDGMWTGFVPGAKPGLRYGYRAHGPWQPEQGHRFNPDKLLIDPAARALSGPITWHRSHFGTTRGDNAAHQVKGVITAAPRLAWQRPRIAWQDTLLYEAHAKGATAQHPDIAPAKRGRLEALSSPPMIRHLKKLGVTAVEILPLMPWADETHLVKEGLTNYWGYNPVNFFALDPRRGTADDFRAMVRRLHANGIEVILDVVFNHSGEGAEDGPSHSLKGLDNASYYRHKPGNRGAYEDFTGCGNTLNLEHPQVTRMVVESLRHWVEEMGVDGFRFDLAATMARSADHGAKSRLLRAIEAGPVLRDSRLIAEPWDIGPDGYKLGQFGAPWSEWNDTFRDTVRKYWRGDEGMMGAMANALSGSRGQFAARKGPRASINFITAHDGFTLADLVSYAHKHNDANKEGNRDGGDHNHSANYGVEGETQDAAIRALRARQRRNMLTTLFIAQGTPMLLAGDEFGNSQRGNNNAYCQDNALSHLDWYRARGDERDFTQFVYRLSDIRKRFAQFRQSGWLTGRKLGQGDVRDVTWLGVDGHALTQADWDTPHHRAFAMHLGGPSGHVMAMMNSHDGPVTFSLPADTSMGRNWSLLLDTANPREAEDSRNYKPGESVTLPARATLLLKTTATPPILPALTGRIASKIKPAPKFRPPIPDP